MTTKLVAAVVAMGLLAGTAADAKDEPKPTDTEKSETADAPPEPAASKTQHDVQIDGQTVKYTATAGWLVMKDDKGHPVARFGYTAYTRDGVKDPARRRVMFAYNGGPGSSSTRLHMGILGLRRVVVNDQGCAPPPPSVRVDNAYSIIDVTDLVMIDPVGTGFSRPLGDARNADFWGVGQDFKSVGQFIKRYLSDNVRWASPKYLLGESYGGLRSAGLAYHLRSTQGMDMNGVVLVSPFLNAGSGVDGDEIDLPHVLYLPTFAATAWYHDAIANKPTSLQAYLDEVEHFAYNEYAPALMRGYVLTDQQKKAIAAKLAAYTGTTADYWEKADLRVSHPQFLQELKRSQRMVAGRIDSRFVGPAVNPLAEKMDCDPFFPAVAPACTAAFLDYLHSELKFGQDENYVVSAFDVEWDWKHKRPGAGGWMSPLPNTVPDLATPYLATKNDIAHLDIAPEARKRVETRYYDAGHMMYLHEPSMRKFREDLVGFVRRTDRL